MKFITRLKNKQGSLYSRTILFGILLLLLCAFIFVTLKSFLIAGEVKKRTIGEMNNLSSRIAADVYDANKQGNLNEYYNKLVSSAAYKLKLLNIVTDNLARSLDLAESESALVKSSTDNLSEQYSITNLKLTQANKADRIEFTISFTLTLKYRIGSTAYEGFIFPVSYNTYHIKHF